MSPVTIMLGGALLVALWWLFAIIAPVIFGLLMYVIEAIFEKKKRDKE